MSGSRMQFAKTIRGKIFLYTGLMFLLVVGIVVAIYNGAMYESLIEHLKRDDMAIYAEKAALEIEAGNAIAVSYAKAVALSQETGMFGKRQETIQYIHSIVENNPQFYDCYVIYEPNGDGQDEAYRQQPGCEASGRFNAVVNNVNGELVLANGVDMETSLYYQGVKEKYLSGSKEKYMITEPYIYEGILMVEQTYPIVVDGKFAGVAGVDRTLGHLSENLSRIRPYKTADFILLSRLGGIVAATMDTRLNAKKINDTPYKDILNYYHMNRGFKEVKEVRDSIDGEKYLYAAAPVKTGDWLLVMRVSTDEVLGPVKETLKRVAIISIVGGTITFLVLLWISNSIARPIQASIRAAERIASGDLTHELKGKSDGETGQLMEAIKIMTRNLNSLVGQVQQSCNQVTSSVVEISASARQLDSTVAEHAASTNQVSASANEISATARNLAETVNAVSDVVLGTADLAGSGRSGLMGMEAKMRDLVASTGSISSRLALISEKANDITQIVTTITKVADQTNLLSLNAAIEAQKAGEQGLGFSVVAREIRRLADQTSVAALHIEKMVKEMQSAVSSGVMGMEKFSEDVSQGMRELKEIARQVEQIIGNVEALGPSFTSVNDGMQSQAQVAQQINEAMLHLNTAAYRTSDSVREFNQAAEQLREAVQGLREEVARFKVA